jgi:hypothetical protein
MAKTLLLTIECEDDTDVGNLLHVLFGAPEAAQVYEDESIETFGDLVLQRPFRIWKETV